MLIYRHSGTMAEAKYSLKTINIFSGITNSARGVNDGHLLFTNGFTTFVMPRFSKNLQFETTDQQP